MSSLSNNPLIGQRTAAQSVPVTMATDQIDTALRARRQMDELATIALQDAEIVLQGKRASDHHRLTDSRGSAGRGSTR